MKRSFFAVHGFNCIASQAVLLLAAAGLLQPLNFPDAAAAQQDIPVHERRLPSEAVGTDARRFSARAGEGRELTWRLTLTVAQAIEGALGDPRLLGLAPETAKREIMEKNRQALTPDLAEFVQPPRTWGDGFSIMLLEAIHPVGTPRNGITTVTWCRIGRET
ncbi:MAG: hypothetical protein FJ387_21130 [Verrucomicrobia bacterium]|nr:hypothetical protein [Verrucomicrobiota bacterium]